jgi:hypothetical protein
VREGVTTSSFRGSCYRVHQILSGLQTPGEIMFLYCKCKMQFLLAKPLLTSQPPSAIALTGRTSQLLVWAPKVPPEPQLVYEKLPVKICREVLVWAPKVPPEDKLHAGHHGLVKCHRRASYSVRWPKLHQQIKERVAKCPVCVQYTCSTHLLNLSYPQTAMAKSWNRLAGHNWCMRNCQ